MIDAFHPGGGSDQGRLAQLGIAQNLLRAAANLPVIDEEGIHVQDIFLISFPDDGIEGCPHQTRNGGSFQNVQWNLLVNCFLISVQRLIQGDLGQ